MVSGFVLATLEMSPRRITVKSSAGEGAAREFDIEIRFAPRVGETVRVDGAGAFVSGSLGAGLAYARTDAASAKQPADRKSIEALSRIPLVAAPAASAAAAAGDAPAAGAPAAAGAAPTAGDASAAGDA
ncbi:MAG: hypothetical protein ABL955_13700, partial [Elusimicrobiota bacterium]